MQLHTASHLQRSQCSTIVKRAQPVLLDTSRYLFLSLHFGKILLRVPPGFSFAWRWRGSSSSGKAASSIEIRVSVVAAVVSVGCFQRRQVVARGWVGWWTRGCLVVVVVWIEMVGVGYLGGLHHRRRIRRATASSPTAREQHQHPKPQHREPFSSLSLSLTFCHRFLAPYLHLSLPIGSHDSRFSFARSLSVAGRKQGWKMKEKITKAPARVRRTARTELHHRQSDLPDSSCLPSSSFTYSSHRSPRVAL